MSAGKGNIKWILMIFFISCINPLRSQVPFSRGVNLTSWFQVSSPGEIQFTKFTKKDLINIKNLGCDVIRLPIAMHDMTSGSPSYTLDPLYFSFLDSVVTWCEQLQLYLILDNHSFDPNGDTSPDVADAEWDRRWHHVRIPLTSFTERGSVAPNPMRSYVEISFTLPTENNVSVNIFSLYGMKIRTLLNDIHNPGQLLFTWDGCNDSGVEVQPGLYFCHVKTPGFAGVCRIIKLK